MSAVYSIFTSPAHPPMPDHLPTLIVTPHGRPGHILYTYLHTNVNKENYLLTPSDAGDLCVAKFFPPIGGMSSQSSSHSHSGGSSGNSVRCEASRNLKWSITQSGIQNPIYKLTLPPSPDAPQQEQPLFQVSKPNPNAGWWTLFYFTYAGHLIPPKRIEFGRIQKNSPESGGGTRVAITGKTDEEKAVWKTLGEGNEDMVEWIVLAAALTVLDDEIIQAAAQAGLGLGAGPANSRPAPTRQNTVPTSSFLPPPPGRPALGPTQQPAPQRRPTAPSSLNYAQGPPPNNYAQGPPPQQQQHSGYLPPQQQQQQQHPYRSRSPQPPPPLAIPPNGYDPRGPQPPNGQGYGPPPGNYSLASPGGGDPRYQQQGQGQKVQGNQAPMRMPSPGPRAQGGAPSQSRQPSTYRPGPPRGYGAGVQQ